MTTSPLATRVPPSVLAATLRPPLEEPRHHILTVAVEDYFQVGAFNRLIQRGKWHRFETRVDAGTTRTLELLREFDVKATFFVLGWVAEQMPELVRGISAEGHEVASKGFYHRSINQMSPEEFRDDLARSREVIERASGRPVHGYRVADLWFAESDLWALDVLAEEGYLYDSSVAPIGTLYRRQPWRRFLHANNAGPRTIWEFPISTTSFLGLNLPMGGNWFRQLPKSFIRREVSRWARTYDAPFVMYFHTWELDPDQPRITAAPWLQRVRQYRNLSRMVPQLRWFLQRYRFAPAARQLGVELAAITSQPAARSSNLTLSARRQGPVVAAANRLRASVVVPCYNEELILPYLANTLANVRAQLESRFQLEFLFVDDGSRDGTWSMLNQLFGSQPDCRVLRHKKNQGVAEAILTGIRAASSNVVCSIDCDCTYDPMILGEMIPMLSPGVDMVTASPYHPKGKVINVPAWRLLLSHTLSRLYRLVLHSRLHTYTSCLRVYRRSSTVRLGITRGGFLGIAELLGRLDLAGGRIVEYPATLEVRLVGRSKMKTLATIGGHIRLLATLARQRIRRSGRTALVASES